MPSGCWHRDASEPDGYCLELRVLLQAVLAHFSSYTGLLEPAERRAGVKNVIAIDPHRTRSDTVRNRMRLTNVASPYGRSQAVQRLVGPLYNIIQIIEFDDAHHGTKNLLASDLHVVLDIHEHCGFNEITARTCPLAALHQLGSFALAGLDITHHFVKLDIVNLRPLLGLRIKGIAHFAFFGASYRPLHKFVVALRFHEHSRSSATALPLIEEETKVGAFHRFVHIGVRKNDVRALSA